MRIKLGIRRDLVRLAVGGDFSVTYLLRDEKPCTVQNEFLGIYSKATSLKSFDFRNENIVGHYFNPRNIYCLDKVIVEPIHGLIYDLNGSLLAESTV